MRIFSNIKTSILAVTVMLSFALVSAVPAVSYAAGSASLSLNPKSGNYNVGKTFPVTISENSGADPINVVEANLAYDSSKLQLVGISCNGGAFEISVPSGNGITCGTSSPKTGGQTVGVANFKVVAAGAGAINFASSSHIYRSTDQADVWNGSTTGASYTLAMAAARPAPAATPPAPTPEPVAAPAVKTATPVAVSSTPVAVAEDAPAWIAVAGIIAALAAGGYLAYLKTPNQRAAFNQRFKNGFRKLRAKTAIF